MYSIAKGVNEGKAWPSDFNILSNYETSKFKFVFEELRTTEIFLAGYFFPMCTARVHPSTLSLSYC